MSALAVCSPAAATATASPAAAADLGAARSTLTGEHLAACVR
jgi:hypothetical protein